MKLICSKVAYRRKLCPQYTCHIRCDTPKWQSLIRSFLIFVLTALSVVVALPARFNGFIIFGIICSSLLRCTLLCPSLGLLWLSFRLARFLPPGSLVCFFCPVPLNLPQLDSFLPRICCCAVCVPPPPLPTFSSPQQLHLVQPVSALSQPPPIFIIHCLQPPFGRTGLPPEALVSRLH